MKKVMLSIKSKQVLAGQADADNNCTELLTEGEYNYENGIASFSYEESIITGMSGTTTSFIVEPDRVVLKRVGTLNSEMQFTKGKRNSFAYETPYGTIVFGLITSVLESDLSENGGSLSIEYSLDVDNMALSKNTFSIMIKDGR